MNIEQIGEQARAQSSEWFANRKRKFLMDDNQKHVASLNKMQSTHDNSMFEAAQASKQRIADYKQQAYEQVETARNEQFADAEPIYEPDTTEGIAQELVNRMNDNE